MFVGVLLLPGRTLTSIESARSDTWSFPRRLDIYSDPAAKVTVSGLHYLLHFFFFFYFNVEIRHKPDCTLLRLSKRNGLIICPEVFHVE